MSKIIPHLWFDKEAIDAVEFYVSIFPNSKIEYKTTLHGVPSNTGNSDIVSFILGGMKFMAINAGPVFTINPSISFFVNFDPSQDSNAKENLEILWNKLMEGGTALMPLNKYPFSEKYGWVQDRYGVNWQLMLTNPSGEPRPYIIPSLMFTQGMAGRAEEAINFYTSVFKGGKAGTMARYGAGMEPNKENSLMFADFNIMGTWLACMDSAGPHKFVFNEGVSLIIPCENQEELDYYTEKMSADPKAEQCGWIKDKFGVSWQVWPTQLGKMLSTGTPQQIDRVTKAFLPMKKFNLAELQKAFQG